MRLEENFGLSIPDLVPAAIVILLSGFVEFFHQNSCLHILFLLICRSFSVLVIKSRFRSENVKLCLLYCNNC